MNVLENFKNKKLLKNYTSKFSVGQTPKVSGKNKSQDL